MIHPPKQDESQIKTQGKPSRFRYKPKCFKGDKGHMYLKPILTASAITLLALATIAASSACAAVQIEIFEDGANVQMDLSGSFDTTGGSNASRVFNNATAGIQADSFSAFAPVRTSSLRLSTTRGPSPSGRAISKPLHRWSAAIRSFST